MINGTGVTPIQTPLRMCNGTKWPYANGTEMSLVGWLDQKGRVWVKEPSAATFDGGSLTPLLIPIETD